MELLLYVVIFIAIIIVPEILAKSKKKTEYKYPDFEDMDNTTKVPGQIIIKKEDTLSTFEEIYFDLEDFFKTEYQQKVKVQEPEPKLTGTQKKYMQYMDKAPEEKTPEKKALKNSSVVPQALAAQNQLSRNDIVRGIVFSEIIMKPRAYRPFRGPNNT